jgi:MFS family permease
MSTHEKETPIAQAASESADSDTPGFRPKGWMYKTVRIAGVDLWYASPKVQLLMVSIVCFLCPGMFNALTGLGGGGQVSNEAQDHANTALYSTFAVIGFFAGTFANRLGLRLTLSIGGLGYCVYAASFLCYSHTQNMPFVVFAGALLGLCAGLLWAAQGSIMMSYPPEQSKGRYISWFWVIFNMGAVIGSLVSYFYLSFRSPLTNERSPLLKTSTRKLAPSPMAHTPLSSLSWPSVPSSPS